MTARDAGSGVPLQSKRLRFERYVLDLDCGCLLLDGGESCIGRGLVRVNNNSGQAKAILCSALMAASRTDEELALAVELKRAEPAFLPIPFLNRLPFRDGAMCSQLAVNCSRAILDAE